jgi:hypothetical protein
MTRRRKTDSAPLPVGDHIPTAGMGMGFVGFIKDGRGCCARRRPSPPTPLPKRERGEKLLFGERDWDLRQTNSLSLIGEGAGVRGLC